MKILFIGINHAATAALALSLALSACAHKTPETNRAGLDETIYAASEDDMTTGVSPDILSANAAPIRPGQDQMNVTALPDGTYSITAQSVVAPNSLVSGQPQRAPLDSGGGTSGGGPLSILQGGFSTWNPLAGLFGGR
jgi:hypothetical protein